MRSYAASRERFGPLPWVVSAPPRRSVSPAARSPKLWAWVAILGAVTWGMLWGGWELFCIIGRAVGL